MNEEASTHRLDLFLAFTLSSCSSESLCPITGNYRDGRPWIHERRWQRRSKGGNGRRHIRVFRRERSSRVHPQSGCRQIHISLFNVPVLLFAPASSSKVPCSPAKQIAMCASAGVRDCWHAAVRDGGHRAAVHLRGGTPRSVSHKSVGCVRLDVCLCLPLLNEFLDLIV